MSVSEQIPPVTTATDFDGAYASLAGEYDDQEHRTTRVLEMLSARGFALGVRRVLGSHRVDSILELGAGTGALTIEMLRAWPHAHLLASDASSEMIEVLAAKLGDKHAGRLSYAVVTADQCSTLDVPPADIIGAGLADPFLDLSTLRALRAACDAGTLLFVSVPSHAWAQRERLERLGVSASTTRFRTRDGGIVLARSMTYDEHDLRALLAHAGFGVAAAGTERSDTLWSQPEVCWAVGAPMPPFLERP